MKRLAGKHALVTGAARRVGRAIAIALAEEGASCLLHYNRSEADVSETAALCRERGVEASIVRSDFRDLAGIERLAADASARGIEVFVHNASTFSRLPFLENSLEAHRAMLERDMHLHVTAPYLLSRALGERMAAAGWGRIVLIGDSSAEAAVFRHYAPYIVSKAATPAMARVLALELGTKAPGVTVNAILPGPMLPPEGHDPEDLTMVRRQTITGRWLGAEAVAQAVVFLATSDEITGTDLRVDGGRSVKAF